jgi:hypothetical protein
MVKTHLHRARMVARLMDSQFSFLGHRFGLDGIIGLIPGVGDAATLSFSLYLLWIGWQYQLPAKELRRMVFNIVVDTVIGGVPVVGDVSDFFFKANLKNLTILEKFLDKND